MRYEACSFCSPMSSGATESLRVKCTSLLLHMQRVPSCQGCQLPLLSGNECRGGHDATVPVVYVLLSGRIHAAICWAVEKHVSNQASQRTCQKEPLAVLLPRMRQWPAAQLVDAAAAS